MYTKILIKQAENGIVGHIYEHVVANIVVDRLFAEGFFRLVDFDLVAKSDDGIVTLRIETSNRPLLKRITAYIQTLSYKKTDINVAIDQIAAEYKRDFSFNWGTLTTALATMHARPWSNMKDFTVSAPITKQARELKTTLGGYGRRNKSKFRNFTFTYQVKNCPYELKSLAVYIIQIVAQNQIDALYRQVKNCYDAGDGWAEYQDLVGYFHELTIPKTSHVDIGHLRKHSHQLQVLVESPIFIRKIQRFIRKDLDAPCPLFSPQGMFTNAYQMVGSRYIKRYVTHKNVAYILSKIEYSIES